MTDDSDISWLVKTVEGMTAGEWRYRPQEFDDWGTIRAGKWWAARSSGNPLDPKSDSDHRRDGTDPYEANGIGIVAAHNLLRWQAGDGAEEEMARVIDRVAFEEPRGYSVAPGVMQYSTPASLDARKKTALAKARSLIAFMARVARGAG